VASNIRQALYGANDRGNGNSAGDLGNGSSADDHDRVHDDDDDGERGLVVRAVEDIFARAAADAAAHSAATQVAITYVQIYNEEVYDLMGSGSGGGGRGELDARGAVSAATPLRLVEVQGGAGQVTVEGAAVTVVRSAQEAGASTCSHFRSI